MSGALDESVGPVVLASAASGDTSAAFVASCAGVDESVGTALASPASAAVSLGASVALASVSFGQGPPHGDPYGG
jgi:hypothetical protein